MEDDLQSAGLSRERVALFVGPRCLLRSDPPPLFRLLNTSPLILYFELHWTEQATTIMQD